MWEQMKDQVDLGFGGVRGQLIKNGFAMRAWRCLRMFRSMKKLSLTAKIFLPIVICRLPAATIFLASWFGA
jgi:hypothetical protein